jgi:tetratricopeptide (TPR) repeat protein
MGLEWRSSSSSAKRAKKTLAVVASLAGLAGGPKVAQGDPPPPSGAASAGPTPTLPELPRLAPITQAPLDPAALRELDRLLERLASEDERSRADARAAIADVTPAFVPAIRHRIQDLRGSFDRDEAARALEAARKVGRKARKARSDGEGKGDKRHKDKGRADEDDDGDWLDFLLASPHPKDAAWQQLVRLLGMTRMLTAVGTTPAVRELVQLHAYFGELVRIDLQRQIAKLRDKAVPALIEARQHDAKMIQKWANKELDVLGRAIPGEAVASNDAQVLQDVLRAYGRTRDVDAARVIISFCNSDRVKLREAAREALTAIGEPAIWQIRDQYLGLTGEKPPRAWTWDRIARELFALYDRQRLAETHTLMEEGLAAAAEGKVDLAVVAFDKVLARAPLYERRAEMVRAYQERAKQLESSQREDALAMMRKGLRLDPKGERAKVIEAEIAYLEGMLSVDRGLPDRTAFEKALALVPDHADARAALAALEEPAIQRSANTKRYAEAGGVGLVALLVMVMLRGKRPPRGGGGSSKPASPEANIT